MLKKEEHLFIGAGVEVYEGMIVGECARAEDIEVNVCKKETSYKYEIFRF